MKQARIIQLDLIGVLALLISLGGIGAYQIMQNNNTNTSLATLIVQQSNTNTTLVEIKQNLNALDVQQGQLDTRQTKTEGRVDALTGRVSNIERTIYKEAQQ